MGHHTKSPFVSRVCALLAATSLCIVRLSASDTVVTAASHAERHEREALGQAYDSGIADAREEAYVWPDSDADYSYFTMHGESRASGQAPNPRPSNVGALAVTGNPPCSLQSEAEHGVIQPPMIVGTDAAASSGEYVYSTIPYEGYVSLSLCVEEAGEYHVWGRVSSQGVTADSFFVSVDGGDSFTWDIGEPGWRWLPATDRAAGQIAHTYYLTTGKHVVTVRTRGARARLDAIELRHASSARKSVTPVPTPPPAVPRTRPTPAVGPPPGNPGSAAIRPVPPVVFALWDYENVDYEQTYPEWPPTGGMVSFRWDDIYLDWDVQDWSAIDRYILQARAYNVTLSDGTVIPKPVAFGVDVSTMDDLGTLWFPAVVEQECGPGLTYVYDPDGEAGACPAYRVPNYSNVCWQEHFLHFVELLGQRYDNNPEYDNLAFVKMNIGWDEEAVAWKVMGRNSGQVCDYSAGPAAGFGPWALSVIAAYNRAFPHLVNVAQLMHHATQVVGDMMATFPNKSTGIKINGWAYDVEGARIFYGEKDPKLVGGVFGTGERWAGTLPIGFEPAGPWSGWQNSYWAWLNMLIAHPDLVDIQPALIHTAVRLEKEIGFPFMEWGLQHMGKTVETTPDVWIALRETRQEVARWCAVATPPYAVDCTRCQNGELIPNGGTYKAHDPAFGPFEYWLYEVRDAAHGSLTYRTAAPALVARGLPEPARSHPYAANSLVRTDQVTGQRYVRLDIADAYAPSTSHVPLAVGGDTVWVITATLVNTGNDSFALQYADQSGQLVTLTKHKGPALGAVDQWVDVSWTLSDAQMANTLPGSSDLALDCAMDGDEIVTRVIVTHYHVTQQSAQVVSATPEGADSPAQETQPLPTLTP